MSSDAVQEHLYGLFNQLFWVYLVQFDDLQVLNYSLDGEPPERIEQVRVVYDYEKEYRVLVARRPDEQQLETWWRGVVLEDVYHTAPVQVRWESNFGKEAWLRMILREGNKRQIREIGLRPGLPVM